MIEPESNVLIVGGTGTLGRALVKEISADDSVRITVLSRDEHKQAAMRREFPDVRFVLGDIRDIDSIYRAYLGKDVVFHVAALKHVDVLEHNITECLKTNVDGTRNSLEAAEAASVGHFVFSSTDKAVDPINVYGMSKAISERYLFAANEDEHSPSRCSVYRWGNVVGSQGSIIPIFAHQLRTKGVVRVTDERMTRFWLPIEWAVRFMIRTFREAHLDRAMICPNMRSAGILDVVKAVAEVVGVRGYGIEKIPIRPGEKLHESMVSVHQGGMASDMWERYTHEELVEMVRGIL